MSDKRIMGIDYGQTRIGIAMSDPLKIIASPYITINRKKTPNYIAEIKKIIEEKQVESIVVGYPLTLSGNRSEQTKITEKFINKLKLNIDTPIYQCDERLSSQEAIRYIREQNIKVGHNKEKVDQISASIILTHFLSSRK